jgi:GNAT superfamily N-acetyltransferase
MNTMSETARLTFHPVTPKRWDDLEQLFGTRGAREGCWCMRWRLPRHRFEQQKGEANRQALKAGIEAGSVRGIIGYVNGEPAAWCSVGPREGFVGLEASEILAPVDDAPVWSVGCFFVAKRFRLHGMATPLLKAAVDYAASEGVRIVEGYPLIPIKDKIPVAFAWTGFLSTFMAAGFVEVERRAPIRPIVRIELPVKDKGGTTGS